MLKTNSKKAIENIRNYIIENYKYWSEYENIKLEKPDNFKNIAKNIYTIFQIEKRYDKGNEQQIFIDWLQGLPSIIDPEYYYRVSAVDILGDILEETEHEKARFTQSQAEEKLSYLIYREIRKAVN